MAAFPHEQRPVPLADDGSNHLLLEVAKTTRDNLHLLCAMSLIFLVVALPWVILATLTSWTLAWTPLVLMTAPVWATIVASADRLLAGNVIGWRTVRDDFRRVVLPALKIGIPPAFCGTVLLGIVRSASDPTWKGVALPALAGMSMAVCVLLIPVVPLAARFNLTEVRLWQESAVVVIRRPAQVLGTVVLAGTGLWLALAFGPAMLLGAAPLGVLIAAITLPDSD